MIETPARIEPCFFQDTIPSVLADLTVELQREADRLGRGLHPESAAELADLVRMMNCYYSNLIEGHNTRPKDIEKALTGAEVEPERRASDVHLVLKTSERTARNTMSALVKQGFLKSETPKAPVRIAFPLDYRERLFPNLFTDAELTIPEPRPLSFRSPASTRQA